MDAVNRWFLIGQMWKLQGNWTAIPHQGVQLVVLIEVTLTQGSIRRGSSWRVCLRETEEAVAKGEPSNILAKWLLGKIAAWDSWWMGTPPSHIADQGSIFLHLAPAHLESRDSFSHPPNKSQVQVTDSQNYAFLSFHVQSHGRWRTFLVSFPEKCSQVW